MILRLKRFSYSPIETEGALTLNDGTVFATVEQPWVPNPNGAKGGKPFHSCVPDGMYQLLPWNSPSKGDVYILFNPDLGVHRLPADHADGSGRDLCLIHVGNYVTDIEGCIAIGRLRAPSWRGVLDSREAMDVLREKLGRVGKHILSIESVTGASDV